MQTFRASEIPNLKQSVLTIGFFDGVHLGHQAVLKELVEWARALKVPAGVLTFSQHPRTVLGGKHVDMLNSLQHRLLLIERIGLDFAWVLDFTPALSQLTAEAFARQYCVEQLAIRGLMLGFDSRFGKDRVGADSPELPQLAARLGFELKTVPPVLIDAQPISSTLIREAIWEGRLKDAKAMLGRNVSVLGKVIHGDARGRRLGFATANLDLDREIRPPFGVYATIVNLEGKQYPSITNVGYRPTVNPQPEGLRPDLLIETHLFDFNEQIYGKTIEVNFIEKIRDERRFANLDALVEQIEKDVIKARRMLEGQV